MEVVITTRTEEALEDFDYRDFVKVEIDGKEVFSVCDDEPEDANLGRSFSDIYGVGALMKISYDAGVIGESFNLIHKHSEYS
jgi:hypothetical protein